MVFQTKTPKQGCFVPWVFSRGYNFIFANITSRNANLMSSRAFPLLRYKQRKLLYVTMTQKVIVSSLTHWGCIMFYDWSHYSLYLSPFHLHHFVRNVHVMSICHIPSYLCVLNVPAAYWLHFITWLLHECPTFAPIKLISFVEENSISRLQCQYSGFIPWPPRWWSSHYLVLIMTLKDVGEIFKELDVINIKDPNLSWT